MYGKKIIDKSKDLMGNRGSKSPITKKRCDKLKIFGWSVKEQRVDGYAIGYYPLDRKITDWRSGSIEFVRYTPIALERGRYTRSWDLSKRLPLETIYGRNLAKTCLAGGSLVRFISTRVLNTICIQLSLIKRPKTITFDDIPSELK